MDNQSTLPVLEKDQQLSIAQDYAALYALGLEKVSQYSGELWTNYNPSDPGVTMLATLCYALTELSFKAQLPVADILTRQNGDIVYTDRFVKPEVILPTNPVTLSDFKKLLLQNIYELKQVYFNVLDNSGGLKSLRPYFEFKPEYLSGVNHSTFLEDLDKRVQQLQYREGNLGQIFLPQVILFPTALSLRGQIFLTNDQNPEQYIAALIYALNNFLSRYPIYQSYTDLRESGVQNGQIFDGPYLPGGFVQDSSLSEKRTTLRLYDLLAVIANVTGTEVVDDLVLYKGDDAVNGTLTISFDEAPYFSYESLFGGEIPLQLIQNGRQIIGISSAKVTYYLKKLIPQPQGQPDLDAFLPKGTYRDLKAYYSIQHHFPELYELSSLSYLQQKDKAQRARIKQLKAFLCLPEQIMANYLAQLNQLGDLFSFQSGRNLYQVAGKTYFFQGIYDVPGIQELLTGVKGYSKKYGDGASWEDWEDYQRDVLNPYMQQLALASESQQDNLDRKTRVLKHLLARFGERYEAKYLQLSNPLYGDPLTAEIQHISDTLRSFATLSSNRIRSYFHPGLVGQLLSGMERNIGNAINLSGYYQGIIDSVPIMLREQTESTQVIYTHDDKREVLLGPDHPTPSASGKQDNGVRLYWQKEPLLCIDITLSADHQLKTSWGISLFLQPYLDTLENLITQFRGFVLVDNRRLLSFLDLQWTVQSADGSAALYRSQFQSLADFEQDMSLIKSSYELQVNGADDDYSISINTEKACYLLCQHLNKDHANQVKVQMEAYRQQPAQQLTFSYQDESTSGIASAQPLPTALQRQRLSTFFPAWVCALQKPAYQEFLMSTMLRHAPARSSVGVNMLAQKKLQQLIDAYNIWRTGLINQYNGESPNDPARQAARTIVNILQNLNHG